MEKHPLHLKNPELQTSSEIQHAVIRKQQRTGEKVPNDPKERIDTYMDRLENIFLNPNEKTRERNLEIFKDKIHDVLIIKRENFPESYFELQKRIARERGQEVEEIPENIRDQMKDVAIEDQKHSLDAWINYLTSSDAVYPPWFKYFVWKNIIKLSQFDKERGEFKKRTDSTVAPFPDIYREPLAQIADIYEKVKQDNKALKEPEVRESFSKKFPALYAELIQKSLIASMESREEIRGQWVKYDQGVRGNAEKLFKSLEGKGTGWCTAGHSTAKAQIENGDFFVYYTNDQVGNPTQPRLAIRMEGSGKIGEIRGVLPEQNVEPVMQEVLDEKLKEFGKESNVYHKKSQDMRHLTSLEKKREKDQQFTKDDLIFLYEINSQIEGFGYEKDPRIKELRSERNQDADMLTIFECYREQIANVPSQINENTKAYVGQLEPGIFQKLPENFEHIYTQFPEKKIRRGDVEIGGKTAEELEREIDTIGNISDRARYMLLSNDFRKALLENPEESEISKQILKKPETISLIRLTVSDLGFKTTATTDQVYQRANDLGLELCPASTGPHYRLKYDNQPMGEWILIGMKQISDSDGNPNGFSLGHSGGGLWLDDNWAEPPKEWDPGYEFVFRLRKSES